jgi:hypothetical protein
MYLGLHVGEVFYGNIGSKERSLRLLHRPSENRANFWSPSGATPCAASDCRRISTPSIPLRPLNSFETFFPT